MATPMPPEKAPRRDPVVVLMGVALVVVLLVVAAEHGSRALFARQAADGALPAGHGGLARLATAYLRVRHEVLAYWWLILPAVVIVPALVLLAIKKGTQALNRIRERASGMSFDDQHTYDLPRQGHHFGAALAANPDPAHQVVLGRDAGGAAVYLTDRARSMHLHCLGQTGSGKTRAVIEPLLFQDAWRGRGVMVVDGKGAQESEERLAAIAAAAGRLDDLRIFTLSPFRPAHTYNPLHLTPGADPRAVAERVFSAFAPDMENPYYRDQSRMFFTTLVAVLAATGRPFHMLDVAAAISSPEVRDIVTKQSSDMAARRALGAQLDQLGPRSGETFTGLLAAVQRYDHPAINVYDPDIVLEDAIDRGQMIGFYLPANYFKQLARYMGLIIFQHLQQLGALRQLDRSRPQTPVYVYADEFYTFAYEGFTDAVNKLRDANIAMLLAHQSLSDLEKVSKEYAQGIWDNTRTKVILLQTNPELCERVAKSLGTKKGIELTVRRSADAWMNQANMLEASSKHVDEYRLHPTRVKMLKTFQAYLAQDADFLGVNLEPLPDLPPASPRPPKRQRVQGLGLHELFISGALKK
jgi:type IV secretory pathway TraG/TraD family ATPase VirD4